MQPKDASVGVLGPGGGTADSGGAVGGAGGADSAVSGPDSGSGNGAIVWTQSSGSPVGDWQAVASSSDGTRLVAVDSRTIYTSGDSGATWSIPPSSPMDNWTSVASSADGTRLIAVGMEQGPALMSDGSWKYGYVYTSSDSGATWAQTGTQGSWTGVASSADGTKLVAVSSDGDIYASTDSGATWTDRTNSPRGPFLLWSSLASSADGTKLVAAGSSEGVTDWPLGYICTSWDSGATWTQRGTLQSWQSLASSADGAKLIAVAGDRVDPGYIYTSGDSGATLDPDWYRAILGVGGVVSGWNEAGRCDPHARDRRAQPWLHLCVSGLRGDLDPDRHGAKLDIGGVFSGRRQAGRHGQLRQQRRRRLHLYVLPLDALMEGLRLDGAIDERDRATADVDAGSFVAHAHHPSSIPAHLLSLFGASPTDNPPTQPTKVVSMKGPFARVAQLVEHRLPKPRVAGPSPVSRSSLGEPSRPVSLTIPTRIGSCYDFTVGFRIRDALLEDLPALGSLAGQLVRLHHGFDPGRWMLPGGVEAGYARYFASQLGNHGTIILLAEDEDSHEIVVYAYASLEERNWAELRDDCGRLHDVLVVERARRQGLATAMLRECLNRLTALGAPFAVASAAWQNETSHALIRSLGFRPTVVEMAKDLK